MNEEMREEMREEIESLISDIEDQVSDIEDLLTEDRVDAKKLLDALENLRRDVSHLAVQEVDDEDLADEVRNVVEDGNTGDLLDAISEVEYPASDGEVLIAVGRAFEEHAREIAEDCHSIPDHLPFTCIDWKGAAEELEHDYTLISIGSYDFLYRD